MKILNKYKIQKKKFKKKNNNKIKKTKKIKTN